MSLLIIQTINLFKTSLEERKGILQRLIELISNTLLKLFRWLQPRRY